MLWQSSQELNAYDIFSGGNHSQQLQKRLEATHPHHQQAGKSHKH